MWLFRKALVNLEKIVSREITNKGTAMETLNLPQSSKAGLQDRKAADEDRRAAGWLN
jgi:hypothetical protein